MAKRDSLLSKLGSTFSESVGVRDGEATLPTYQDTAARRPPAVNFVRSRSDGDISVAEVIADPDQPRKHFDDTEIEHLAASIQKHGLLQAIRVRWSEVHGKWVIVAGERRYRAHLHAGIERIRCHFDAEQTDETTIRSQSIIENVLREDLTGIELAEALKHLMDKNGWNATQVGQELNIPKSKVSKALALLKLPADVQDQVRNGAIAPTTAYQLTKVKDRQEQLDLIEKAKSGAVTSLEAAKATSSKPKRTRKTTNESFRTSEGVRVVISSRRDIGEQGMIGALLEVADEIRKRTKKAA